MTIREQVAKRQQEIEEFFAWRFGTKRWIRPAVYATGCHPSLFQRQRLPLGTKAALSARAILRIEAEAIKLGFKPGTQIDVSKPPVGGRKARVDLSKPPVDGCKLFYFEIQKERERKARLAAQQKRDAQKNIRRSANYHADYHNIKLPILIFVDNQEVRYSFVQDGESSHNSGTLRKPRRGRRKVPDHQEPNQLLLGLDP